MSKLPMMTRLQQVSSETEEVLDQSQNSFKTAKKSSARV